MATSTQWLQPAGAEQSKQVMRNGNNIFLRMDNRRHGDYDTNITEPGERQDGG